jgi:hypothetical protein
MSLSSSLRSLERTWLRPLGRRLRLPLRGRRAGRIAALEGRVEELESLVRELTGLVYLRLDDEAGSSSEVSSEAAAREAA